VAGELIAAIHAARAAGEILRAGFGQSHKVQLKGPIDIVTEVDRAAEDRIIALLGRATPDYGFLTEERDAILGKSDARWIVDPLDGTANYASGYPRFCVSIALERAGELELGVIYDPLRDELFTAQCGAGAMLNGRPVRVNSTNSLARAVISTGFSSDVRVNEHNNPNEMSYFVGRVLGLRSTGSVALDLADVACGRRDAHWERGLSPYDVAAGALLVRESGGMATDYEGDSNVLYGGEIIAANPALHREMLACLRTCHVSP
jgi:myo-inositol-1(or 4)-monophosphatase